MTAPNLFLPILLPVIAAALTLLLPSRLAKLPGWITVIVSAIGLWLSITLFGQEATFVTPWGGFGIEFSLRLYHFSSFILLGAAGFGILIGLYSVAFMDGRKSTKQFFAYFLFTLALVNGAALANNLILMLFFWEGLLVTLFAMIAIGHKEAFRTATKAFVIAGITDLCMMLGIGLAIHLAGTATMTGMRIPLDGMGSVAFILMIIGATSKAGSMPFHSWIPDAAIDAPLPFMALVPAALEKLLGIYLLARITLDLFQFSELAWVSTLLMILGSATILLAVMMALVQKDFKRLLSFHAISQVGYMILGIGTGMPAGIVGGLFHMINHAMYKSCLFLTGGNVEKQVGTTDLRKLGGLGSLMPVTFMGFLIAAASISGVPPFNGFFSKELVYEGALERGTIFYLAAVLGSFLTAASFLKLGHAAFLGKGQPENTGVKEAPWPMLIPVLVLAALCVLFGVYNPLPLNHLIQPILGEARLAGHNYAGFHLNPILIGGTLIALAAALLNHWWGVKKSGSGLGASDHIHYAPGLHAIYDKAEQRWFDPYEIGLKIAYGFGRVAWWIDRGIDWVYNVLVVEITNAVGAVIRKSHTGSHAMYLGWSLLGLIVVIVSFMRG